ncbi:MAG: efflux RND transporter periplasmic adaptor subunit [Gammaproteobacteria bacterium]|nr:efflux RND transporter periplasmic adaptor subunit [Gammaproteobacteria bacterium]
MSTQPIIPPVVANLWLALQCQVIPGIVRATVFPGQDADSEYPVATACWRADGEDTVRLRVAALAQKHPLPRILLAAIVLLAIAAPGRADDPGAIPPLDCVLQPYAVVEVSSAVEGVINQIHVDRNDTVARGQLLVELDSDVERAQVDLARTRAGLRTNIELRETELAFSQRKQRRLDELYKTDTISLHTKDEAETDTNKSRLQLRNARDSQRLAELELAKAEAILALRSMLSPIDGVVVSRNKVAGEFVEDDSILRLAQLDPLKVEVIVPVELFGSIEEGMLVEVMPEHYGEAPHLATVTLVDRVVDAASGTFDVRAELPNPDHAIPSGLRCTVQFLKNTLPAAAIADAADGKEDPIAAAPTTRAPTVAMLENERALESVQPRVEEQATIITAGLAETTAEFLPTAVLAPVAKCIDTRQTVVESYKVLADPALNATTSDELVMRLRAQGIHDLYVMQRGANSGHVALGVYAEKPNAEQRLADLSRRGFQVELEIRSRIEAESACLIGQQFAGTTY